MTALDDLRTKFYKNGERTTDLETCVLAAEQKGFKQSAIEGAEELRRLREVAADRNVALVKLRKLIDSPAYSQHVSSGGYIDAHIHEVMEFLGEEK